MRPNAFVARIGASGLSPHVDVVFVHSNEIQPVFGVVHKPHLFDSIARVAVDELVDELETGVLAMAPQDDDVIESDGHERAVELPFQRRALLVRRCELDSVHVVGREIAVSVAGRVDPARGGRALRRLVAMGNLGPVLHLAPRFEASVVTARDQPVLVGKELDCVDLVK